MPVKCLQQENISIQTHEQQTIYNVQSSAVIISLPIPSSEKRFNFAKHMQ